MFYKHAIAFARDVLLNLFTGSQSKVTLTKKMTIFDHISTFLNTQKFWESLVAKNFVLPTSTTNEIASGQSSGDLNTFRVHKAQKGEWTVKKWVYFSSYKNSKILRVI